MPDVSLLLTCEHAVNTVPERWQHLYRGNPEVLATHRGWDPGAAELAQYLARGLSAPCVMARVSRLLLDHNRSPQNRSLWSEYSRDLPAADKALLLDEFYHPFREQTGRCIAGRHAVGERVVHISVHSFTPVLDGKVRNLDIGLLYDTARPEEASFVRTWKSRLVASHSGRKVRFNIPYRGRSDCHGRTYRGIYDSKDYIGIELEINQALLADGQEWEACKRLLGKSLRDSLGEISTDA
jgi:predicted N-formylglutamate amidohydrolase